MDATVEEVWKMEHFQSLKLDESHTSLTKLLNKTVEKRVNYVHDRERAISPPFSGATKSSKHSYSPVNRLGVQ